MNVKLIRNTSGSTGLWYRLYSFSGRFHLKAFTIGPAREIDLKRTWFGIFFDSELTKTLPELKAALKSEKLDFLWWSEEGGEEVFKFVEREFEELLNRVRDLIESLSGEEG